jgi:hypothetical protein
MRAPAATMMPRLSPSLRSAPMIVSRANGFPFNWIRLGAQEKFDEDLKTLRRIIAVVRTDNARVISLPVLRTDDRMPSQWIPL